MKNNSLGLRAVKIFAAVGCLLLAVMVWLVVRYAEQGMLPIAMSLG